MYFGAGELRSCPQTCGVLESSGLHEVTPIRHYHLEPVMQVL